MQQVTIREFLQGKADHLEGGYHIYIFRNGTDVFYVGRSINPVQRVYDHIEKWTSSSIGDIVRQNIPASLSWQVDFLTPEECRPFVNEFYASYYSTRPIDIELAEEVTIRHYGPCANVQTNLNPHPFPEYVKQYRLKVGITDNLY